MTSILNKIKAELKKASDKEKAKLWARYFKMSKGGYGEGDILLGIAMPKVREIVKKYFGKISVEDTLKLLRSKFYEERMTALLILMFKYKKGSETEKKKIFNLYLANTKFINNWGLIDVTCPHIIGDYLFERNRNILYKLAESKSLWERRIAIVSTFYFISKNQLSDTYKIAKMLLNDKHDLIHKAVGWALREAGKKDESRLIEFLKIYRLKMPRTSLRYAIERLSPKIKQKLMKK